MALSVVARNYMLDQVGAGKLKYVSLHSADPGATGASELAGVSRVAVTFAAAANGSMSKTGTLAFSVPAGSSVAAYGFWDLASGGVWQGGDLCRDGSNAPIVESFAGAGTYTLNTLAVTD